MASSPNMTSSTEENASKSFTDLAPSKNKSSHLAEDSLSVEQEQENKKPTFFDLPGELRNQIYDLLLVNPSDRPGSRSLGGGDTHQEAISLPICYKEYNILQASKKIRNEAIPIFLSQNIFSFRCPIHMLTFIQHIGLKDLAWLSSLDICVPWDSDVDFWLQLLNLLARRAKGLRSMKLEWKAHPGVMVPYPLGRKERGLGDNLAFVHALAKISGLEKLTISGFYVLRWQIYLKDEMRVDVRAIDGYDLGEYVNLGEMDIDDLVGRTVDDFLDHYAELRRILDVLSKMYTQRLDFYMFQLGTEFLFPWSRRDEA